MTCKTKILIAEGNIPAAMRMVYLLTSANCDVEVAPTEQRAMDLAQNHEFDLVILDEDLLDIGGVETCRRLKRGHMPRLVPLIIISTHSGEQRIRKDLEFSATDHIASPFEPTDFIFRVKSQAKAVSSRPKIG